MKTVLSVDEYDLLNFFEVMPTPTDHDIEWAYNDSLYKVNRSNLELSFAITPACRDATIKLKAGGLVLYELNATGVKDVRRHRDKGRDSLEIVLMARESIWIRLRPEISIYHSVSADGRE